MESLLVLAAFSFGLASAPVAPTLSDFELKEPTLAKAEVAHDPLSNQDTLFMLSDIDSTKTQIDTVTRLSVISRILSPSIRLNKVSWLDSKLTQKYDPLVSVQIKRGELRGFDAVVQVSIPL